MQEPLEIECWVDPKTDEVLVKIRKFEVGQKKGIILVVRDDSLFNLAEGMEYPRYRLPSVTSIGDLKSVPRQEDSW